MILFSDFTLKKKKGRIFELSMSIPLTKSILYYYYWSTLTATQGALENIHDHLVQPF